LRLRRVGDSAHPQWLQTFKTGGSNHSALSQRGEWETQVSGAELDWQALQATPWASMDPDGRVFASLTPCFVTRFERTSWLIRRRDGAVVEVALDVGEIEASGKTTPICELELELKAGQPDALFDMARQIAQSIAVLPASVSKAERGFGLARDSLNQPLHAQPPQLNPDLPLSVAAQRLLREMFNQFTGNLNGLRSSDDPALVHQARIGWRRFKSALQLFKPVLRADPAPDWQGLQPLLTCLGELRDLDVARTETLPALAPAYVNGDAQREQTWQSMMQAFTQAADLQRKAVRYALQDPTVGTALLATTQWLEGLTPGSTHGKAAAQPKRSLRPWGKRRLLRLQQQLKRARHKADTPELVHRVRILAKRLRYSTEALRSLLPKKLAKQLNQQATRLQISMGTTRDRAQAATLVARLDVDRGLAEFLRGVAVSQTLPPANVTSHTGKP
jgi:inorganic triphosphatase YgiF